MAPLWSILKNSLGSGSEGEVEQGVYRIEVYVVTFLLPHTSTICQVLQYCRISLLLVHICWHHCYLLQAHISTVIDKIGTSADKTEWTLNVRINDGSGYLDCRVSHKVTTSQLTVSPIGI